MRKIAIIGGSGFIGTRLISLLSTSPELEVVNIDKAQSATYPSITKICDVLDTPKLTELLQGVSAVVLLAAEHKDNVTPKSLYYDVNVGGMKSALAAMDANGIKKIIFTSSVAVYGLNKVNPSEQSAIDPFNDYGKSKWQAEEVAMSWYDRTPDADVTILRPTVVFGEANRGNVYNLLKQISSGKFLMIGSGNNCKSMAYVGNIVAFLAFALNKQASGYEVYNYTDKPDLSMNDLVDKVELALDRKLPAIRFPYWLGMCGAYGFDLLAAVTRKKLTISSVRVKKFCATTQFDSTKVLNSGFVPPFKLEEGLSRTIKSEFVKP